MKTRRERDEGRPNGRAEAVVEAGAAIARDSFRDSRHVALFTSCDERSARRSLAGSSVQGKAPDGGLGGVVCSPSGFEGQAATESLLSGPGLGCA